MKTERKINGASAICVRAVVLATLAAAIFTGCNRNNASASASSQNESDAIVYAVNTYKTEAGSLDQYLEFGGDVAAVSAVDVLPDVAGKISRTLVSVGEIVRRDQVIAYVDASRPGMSYSESPVRAPVAGRIITTLPSIGTTVSQAYSIAQISNTDDLEIRINVPERFVSRIQNGQAATISFSAYPSETFSAHVVEVSPVLDTATRTMSAKLRLDRPDERIKVGMYGTVRLVTESVHDVIVVPENVVITRQGKPYVFVVQDAGDSATVKMQEVTAGITVDDQTEITDGLNAGDEIVASGQSLLNDGARVNVVSVINATQNN